MLVSSVLKLCGVCSQLTSEKILKVNHESQQQNRYPLSKIIFLEHAKIVPERREVKTADYMSLHFKVKHFYDTSVKINPEAKTSVPEYPK